MMAMLVEEEVATLGKLVVGMGLFLLEGEGNCMCLWGTTKVMITFRLRKSKVQIPLSFSG